MPEKLNLPASRIELVQEEIRRAILTHELPPGRPLVETELAQRLGVSKTPVREALKILSGSGLVTFEPYKGAAVRQVDRELAVSVYDVRLLLEPEAVRRSVEVGDETGFTAAHELLDSAREAIGGADHSRLSLLNREFHARLYRGCGNPLLVSMLDDLRDRAALVNVVGWRASPTWEHEWEQHHAILDAASADDGKRAAELLRDHIQEFLDRVLTALDSQPS